MKKLIAGLSAIVVAMVVIVLCFAVFSEGPPAAAPLKDNPTAESALEESQDSEFVKIKWQTDLGKDREEQPGPQTKKAVTHVKDEGETD